MERVGEITGWPHITFGRKRKIRSDVLFIERESNKIITVLLYCPIGKCSALIYILKLLYTKKTPDDSNGRHVWIGNKGNLAFYRDGGAYTPKIDRAHKIVLHPQFEKKRI